MEPADAVGVHQHWVEPVVGQHLPPPLGSRQVSLATDRVLVVGVVPVDVDGQPTRRLVPTGAVDAELATRLCLPKVLAKGVVVEVHLSPLCGKRGGDGPSDGLRLVSNIPPPDVGAIDQMGHYPDGQVVGAGPPLTGNAIEVVHGAFLAKEYACTIFLSGPSRHKCWADVKQGNAVDIVAQDRHQEPSVFLAVYPVV